MQEFKPSNTRHIIQDIKGHAVLASSVMIALLTSFGLTSHSGAHTYLVQGSKASLEAIVNETPTLLKDAIFFAKHYSSQYLETAPGSFEVENIATPATGQALTLDVKFAPVDSIAVSITEQQPTLSSSDFLKSDALGQSAINLAESPFGGRAQTKRLPSKNARKAQVASLSEVNNFLALKHSRYTYVDNKYFLRNTKKLLPKYKGLFQKAAKKYDLDWRLVASIAYQESVWDPQAVSPTGVRGMMMLTKITAKEMNVKDRTNVTQSIFGGAGYFRKLLNRIPAEVKGVNRELMALASYNMGYGHLIAARKLTAQQGADNTVWKEVKKRLPLLQQRKYYKNSPYGYAGGARQALHYVGEIQKHYDMLLMLTEHGRIKEGRSSTTAIKGFELARY